MKSEEIAEVVE